MSRCARLGAGGLRGVVVLLLVVATGCDLGALDDDPSAEDADAFDCPATVNEGGITDGIDLALPLWAPPGLPLPEGMSLRHISVGGTNRSIVGFVEGGERGQLIPLLHGAFVAAGYESLLWSPELVPLSTHPFVVLEPGLGWIVVVSAGTDDETGAVPIGEGRCEFRPGLVVQMLFGEVDAPEARERYAASSLGTGTAAATVGDTGFEDDGVCFVHDGTHRFDGFWDVVHDPLISLTVSPATADSEAFVHGEVTVQDATTDLLYVMLGDGGTSLQPIGTVTADGFSAVGEFRDAVGDDGILPGSITVTCS